MQLDRVNSWMWGRRSPVRLVMLWLLGMIAITVGVEIVMSLAGLRFSLLAPKVGLSVLDFAMFAMAMVVMRESERPPSAFGLTISHGWRSRALVGLGLGSGVILLLVAVTLLLGGWSFNVAGVGRWLTAIGKGFAALPITMLAMIPFAGFIAGALRERFSSVAASGIAAGLYALAHLSTPADQPPPVHLAAATTSFLLMFIAARLRFLTGDLSIGVGFLFGAIFVERVVRKAPVFGHDGNADITSILAPDRRILRAPAMWGALSLIALWSIFASARRRGRDGAERGETRPAAAPSSPSAAFLRVYPFATMGALAPLDVWLPQLVRARFRVGLVYAPRLLATLALSAINTVLTTPERLLVPLLLRGRRIKAPVFILGVHRSGTTHLHNMLSLDPLFVAPTSWQVMNPHGFFVSGRLLRPIVAIFAPWRRPMDAVRFGLSTAAEEEFAVANMSGVSPDWSSRLPKLAEHYDRFGFPDAMSERELARFRAVHKRFLLACTFGRRGRPLLKSPHNTGRLHLLADLYPGAVFVHIRRHPEDVHRSNVNMARTAHILFQLQDPDPGARYEDRFPSLYRAMEERMYRDADARGWEGVVEVRYEDLVANPRAEIERLYDALGLPFTGEFEQRLTKYLAGIAGYQPSERRPLAEGERNRLFSALGGLVERWRAEDAHRIESGARSIALVQRTDSMAPGAD